MASASRLLDAVKEAREACSHERVEGCYSEDPAGCYEWCADCGEYIGEWSAYDEARVGISDNARTVCERSREVATITLVANIVAEMGKQ